MGGLNLTHSSPENECATFHGRDATFNSYVSTLCLNLFPGLSILRSPHHFSQGWVSRFFTTFHLRLIQQDVAIASSLNGGDGNYTQNLGKKNLHGSSKKNRKKGHSPGIGSEIMREHHTPVKILKELTRLILKTRRPLFFREDQQFSFPISFEALERIPFGLLSQPVTTVYHSSSDFLPGITVFFHV